MAKRDEEIMLKRMAEKNAKEQSDIEKKRELEMKNKSNAGQALLAQMQEKKQKTLLGKETDAFYANEIAQRVQSV